MIVQTQNRWEWRAFAATFDQLDESLRQGVHVRASRELYVVCDGSRENVKIRDGVLDIKTLDEVNADGLQLWRPVVKQVFPLSQTFVRELFARWGLEPPPLTREHYTLKQWMTEIVEPHAGLHVVTVCKERYASAIDGCTVESADLLINGSSVRTIAVESVDPWRVMHVVRTLGLRQVHNEDYPPR